MPGLSPLPCQAAGPSGFGRSATLCSHGHSCWPQKLPLFFRNFCFSVLRAAKLVDFGSQSSALKYGKNTNCKVSTLQGESEFPSFQLPLSLPWIWLSIPPFWVSFSIALGTTLSRLGWQVLPISSTKATELCRNFILCLLIAPNRFSICRLEN